MTIRKRSAALLVAAALLLSGCTAEPAAPAPSDPAATDDHGDHDILVPLPSTTPDPAVVATRAVDALSAYGRRDLAYDEWFTQLQPFLDETAVDAYATVNPSRIPAFTIDKPGETADVTATHAVVYVDTSIGRYTIELRRADASAEWGVTRLQPPN